MMSKATGFFDLSKPHLAMIYAALTGKDFNPKVFNTISNGQRRTAVALREAGLKPEEAFDVLLNMVERGDEITPATLKAELDKRAERAAFEADSDDGDAPSDDESLGDEIDATEPEASVDEMIAADAPCHLAADPSRVDPPAAEPEAPAPVEPAPAPAAEPKPKRSSDVAADGKRAKLLELLLRPEGVLAREILAACNWSIVSGRIAETKKAHGLTIRKVRENSDTRYFATMPGSGAARPACTAPEPMHQIKFG
jgi:hypothetical protein